MKPLKPFESLSYNGKTIVIVDISNTRPEEAIPALREAQQQIALLPRKSVLILTDATNAVFNKESAKAMKEFAAKNSPFVKASAVVGAVGFSRGAVRGDTDPHQAGNQGLQKSRGSHGVAGESWLVVGRKRAY